MSDINKQNVLADSPIYGNWSKVNKEYFSNVKYIKELYALFDKEKIHFPKKIKIIEVGSADGLVGEYFKKELSKNHEVDLSILDIVPQHLEENKNKSTTKIHCDLLDFKQKREYDLVIMRSLLHYFSKEEQFKVLQNTYDSLDNGGYFLIQAFVQRSDDLELFLKLNSMVGKKLQLLETNELKDLFLKTGFSDIRFLGDVSTWNCSSDNLKIRYEISGKTLENMRKTIKSAQPKDKRGFELEKSGFTIPIPYKVFIMRKS